VTSLSSSTEATASRSSSSPPWRGYTGPAWHSSPKPGAATVVSATPAS